MLNLLLIAAGSAAFIGAVAKILDLPLRQSRPPLPAKGPRRPRRSELPPESGGAQPKPHPVSAEEPASDMGTATSKLRASWRLALLVLTVGGVIAALIVALIGWLAASIDKALA